MPQNPLCCEKKVYMKVSSTPLPGNRRKGARMVAPHNRGSHERWLSL